MPPSPSSPFDLLGEAPVPVPGRPGVFLRILCQAEWEAWGKSIPGDDAPEDEQSVGRTYASLVKLSACDKEGHPLFADLTPEQIAGDRRLGRKMLHRLYQQALDLNKLEDLESEKKDSGPIPPSASGSGSAVSTA